MKEIKIQIPSDWRKGQYVSNLLRFIESDPFYMSDESFDKLVELFNNGSQPTVE